MVLRLLRQMNAAVELDDEPGLVAVEIRDIGTDDVLSAELCCRELTVPQALPQERFSGRPVAPELARPLQEGRWHAKAAIVP